MLRDSILEFFDRRVIYVFAAVTLVGIIVTLASLALDIEIQGRSLGAGDLNRAFGNPMLQGYNQFMYVLVFLAVMATAGMIPRMLAPGRADFYLSKPVSRAWLLLSRTFSIWVVYSCVMTAAFLTNYILSAALYGGFSLAILYIIILNLLSFVIWLSVIAFSGVATGSTAISVMIAFAVWLTQRILSYHDLPKEFVDSKAVIYAIDALYYIFPKTSQISDMSAELITRGATDWMPLYSSIVFAAVLMFITVLIFRHKEY
jgi:ABC-type transport system involved in multi-copper enzyme maturation permease subunit